MMAAFDDSELEVLCFDLQIDCESLPGDGKVDLSLFAQFLKK